eukprot:TRINITY_DN17663_c0_g1_i1.p1 TRINITY_DN17663_c0_g1~~TRINITY_DN17663_c0_g1_i1.p1  ORF type:complete len:251 (+),score=65.26 TRINITY_DN17663_c0_g1_i1:121-873(+)
MRRREQELAVVQTSANAAAEAPPTTDCTAAVPPTVSADSASSSVVQTVLHVRRPAGVERSSKAQKDALQHEREFAEIHGQMAAMSQDDRRAAMRAMSVDKRKAFAAYLKNLTPTGCQSLAGAGGFAASASLPSAPQVPRRRRTEINVFHEVALMRPRDFDEVGQLAQNLAVLSAEDRRAIMMLLPQRTVCELKIHWTAQQRRRQADARARQASESSSSSSGANTAAMPNGLHQERHATKPQPHQEDVAAR